MKCYKPLSAAALYTLIVLGVAVVILGSVLLGYFIPIWIKVSVPQETAPRGYTYTIWRTRKSIDCVPLKWYLRAHMTWVDLCPGARIVYFTDAAADEFLERFHAIPGVKAACDALDVGAFKADLFRLCVLYERGGVYVDADAVCYRNLASSLAGAGVDVRRLTEEAYGMLVSSYEPRQTYQHGYDSVHNGFIVATPRHPAIKEAIDIVVHNVSNRLYGHHFLSISGPVAFARAIRNVFYPEQERVEVDVLSERLSVSRVVDGREATLKLYTYKGFCLNASQRIYDFSGKVVLDKKYCLYSYLRSKLTPGSYYFRWRNRDVYAK